MIVTSRKRNHQFTNYNLSTAKMLAFLMVYYVLFITLKTFQVLLFDLRHISAIWICENRFFVCMLLQECPSSFANLLASFKNWKNKKTEFWYLISFYRMKVINTNQSVIVPDDVDVTVKSRVVTVKGHRGTLTKVRKLIYAGLIS